MSYLWMFVTYCFVGHGSIIGIKTPTLSLTKDKKNIVLLPWRDHEDRKITDHNILLQGKETKVRLSMLVLSEHNKMGPPFDNIQF